MAEKCMWKMKTNVYTLRVVFECVGFVSNIYLYIYINNLVNKWKESTHNDAQFTSKKLKNTIS
jgi:hypothetical protein